MPHAPDEGRAPARQPGQAQEVDARLMAHAAVVARLAAGLEAVHLQPAEVHPVARGPDDGGDAGGGQVEFAQRMGHALRIGQAPAGLGLLGQVQAVAADVVVGRIEHGQVVGVAVGDVLGQVVPEAHPAIGEGLGQPHQGDALVAQRTKVHGVAAARAADGNGHMLAAGLGNSRIPFAQHAQPPAEITAAIGARRPVMGAYREKHLAARALQLIGNLHARGACAHHQHGSFGQLCGAAVVRGMDLQQAAIGGCRRRSGRYWRDHRHLERPRGRDHVAGLDHALGRFHREARPALVARDPPDLHAGAHGRLDLADIVLEVVGHLVLAGKAVAVALELQARKAVMPGRPVGHQRVPAPRAPGLGDALALQHQVLYAKLAQVFAGRDAGLPGTDHERVDGLNVSCHGVGLSGKKGAGRPASARCRLPWWGPQQKREEGEGRPCGATGTGASPRRWPAARWPCPRPPAGP